jgi:putative hydrolase of the HAD superfamily
MDYVPKPDPRAYAAMCTRFAIDPARALFVEDMARNLEPAKALGMTTVWIDNGSERGDYGADPAFIDYHIGDIGAWLTEILMKETHARYD